MGEPGSRDIRDWIYHLCTEVVSSGFRVHTQFGVQYLYQDYCITVAGKRL